MTEAQRITLEAGKAIREMTTVILDIQRMPYTSKSKRLLVESTMVQLLNLQQMLKDTEVYRG